MVDHGSGNCVRLGACEPGRFRSIGDHDRDLGGVGALLRRLDQRGHIRTATGDQDTDALLGHALTGNDRDLRDKQASAAIRSSLIRSTVGRRFETDAQNDRAADRWRAFACGLGTWESVPVQWLDRGYTDMRMAACDDGRGGDDGACGPRRGANLSIPNLITLGRILLVPVVVWAITAGEMRVAFVLFLAAGISDAVDGFLAKRFGMTTELGAYLDPLADKAMLVSIYVALGIADAVPGWLVILVVSRDIMIVSAVILSWLVDQPVGLKPLLVSKLNTVAQIVLAAVVLAALGFDFDASLAIFLLMALVTAFTLISIAFYVAEWVRHMNAAEMGP